MDQDLGSLSFDYLNTSCEDNLSRGILPNSKDLLIRELSVSDSLTLDTPNSELVFENNKKVLKTEKTHLPNFELVASNSVVQSSENVLEQTDDPSEQISFEKFSQFVEKLKSSDNCKREDCEEIQNLLIRDPKSEESKHVNTINEVLSTISDQAPTESFVQNQRTGTETEFEDSMYTAADTRSNTESFSELRFSVSETHSEFDSQSEASAKSPTMKSVEDFNLIDRFPDLCSYQREQVDDTSGILYKMSEQINKVPQLLGAGLNKQKEEIGVTDLLESSSLTGDSDDTLEEKVLKYFSQCDDFSVHDQSSSKGQEELGKLEAAVERMLTQVEIQENLLKEDVSFVPLVLEKKEVKALPLLVDTLCLSPQLPRKPVSIITKIDLENKNSSHIASTSNTTLVPERVISSIKVNHGKTQNSKNTASCSITELENSVNRLLSEVEKEEERLRCSSSDSRRTCNSTSSTTDVSSEEDSYSVWWEGAYRSLPRHSARKKLTRNVSHKQTLLKPPQYPSWSQGHTSDDSDTSKESVKLKEKDKRPHTKLVVRTVESGKSAIEIRTGTDFMGNTNQQDESKFYKMFKRSRSEAHSLWNRSLPSLHQSPLPLRPSLMRSLGSDDSINYVKYTEPSDCIQYFTPCATMDLDSEGYCTWTPRFGGGKFVRVN